MMGSRYAFSLFLAAAIGVASASAALAQPAPTSGDKGGGCYRNGTCNEGLSCDAAQNLCVDQLPDGGQNGPCYGNGTCNPGLECDEARGICIKAADTPATTGTDPAPGPSGDSKAPQPTGDDDDDDGDDDDDDGDDDDGAADPAPPTAAGGVGPFTKAKYPISLVDRPLSLVKGMLELNGTITRASVTIGENSASATGLAINGAFGITDKAWVRTGTGLGLDPDVEWWESVSLGGGFLAYDTAKLDIAGTVGTNLDLSGGEDTDVMSSISLGALTRFNINPQLAAYFGYSLLHVRFADPSAVDLDINAELGFQATDNLFMSIATQFVSIAVSGEFNETSSFGDFIPVTLSGGYAVSNMLDAYFRLWTWDLSEAGDLWTMAGGVAVRI